MKKIFLILNLKFELFLFRERISFIVDMSQQQEVAVDNISKRIVDSSTERAEVEVIVIEVVDKVKVKEVGIKDCGGSCRAC